MPNFLQNGVLAFSRSQIGAWLFSRVGHHVDRWTYQITGNRATFSSWLAGMPMVMVESIGRKTGKVSLIPLVAIQKPNETEKLALIASNWGQKHYPAWYYNLLAKGEARVTIAGKINTFKVHEAKDAEYQAYWETAAKLIPNYQTYEERIAGARPIPILVLERLKS